MSLDSTSLQSCPREKYVFLVRHAQSTWNQNVELVKTFRNCSFEGLSMKDVVSRVSHLMAKDFWDKDHPISENGKRQTEELRRKIGAKRQLREEAAAAAAAAAAPGAAAGGGTNSCGSSCSSSAAASGPRASPLGEFALERAVDAEERRVQRYYESFLSQRQQIYCSPLLRALQTADLVLRREDGWGSIKLLKDAREWFSFALERDCLGTGVGEEIIDRAMQMGQELPGLHERVDATDCAEQWWSDAPESEAEVETRLTSLWKRLLEEDRNDSCVLVTHSNLIKALLMRFGGVDDAEDVGSYSPADSVTCDRGRWDVDTPDSSYRGFSEGPQRQQQHSLSESRREDAAACRQAAAAAAASAPAAAAAPAPPLWDFEPVEVFDGESAAAWQVVGGGSEALRRLKVEKIQTCGVLGLKCVREAPAEELYPEDIDGWVDVDSWNPACRQCVAEPRWIAKDALLMFDSVLVK